VAEGGQRPRSRLAHDDLGPWAVDFGGLRSREQRQFVDRQRPTRLGRRDERDAADLAGPGLFEHLPIRGCGAIAEHEHTVRRHQLTSADRQQQRVVADHFATGVGGTFSPVDPVEALPNPANPGVGHDPSHRVAQTECGAKRLEDGERPIHKRVRGAHQSDVKLIARQPTKPQHRLHTSDTTTADND